MSYIALGFIIIGFTGLVYLISEKYDNKMKKLKQHELDGNIFPD